MYFRLIILLLFYCNICVASESQSIKSNASQTQNIMVGGWYPVFFDKYSDTKVNQIIESVKSGQVKRIMISFDKNNILAIKIKNNIQAKTHFPITMNHINQKDDTAQYDHARVVVTIWSK